MSDPVSDNHFCITKENFSEFVDYYLSLPLKTRKEKANKYWYWFNRENISKETIARRFFEKGYRTFFKEVGNSGIIWQFSVSSLRMSEWKRKS